VSIQVYRVLGLIFLVLYAGGRLPGAFALPAGRSQLYHRTVCPGHRHRLCARAADRPVGLRAWNSIWDWRFNRGRYDRLPNLTLAAPDAGV
jgi:hypothetical protein